MEVKITNGVTTVDVEALPNANALPVAIVDTNGDQLASIGGGSEYTEGDTDVTIVGKAILWEDTGDTLKTVSSADPLPVNVVAGSTAGTEYTEGDTDATITGTAILWEDAANTLKTVSEASPFPSRITDSVSSLAIANDGATNVTTGIMAFAKERAGGDDVPVEALNLTNSNPVITAIVDGNGDQITSFGGGVEYTEGDVDASITGKAVLMEVGGNTLQPIQGTVADGLLVNLGANNDVTVTNSTVGTNPGTNVSMTVTNLQSLASSATVGWQSDRVSNLSTKATDYMLFVKLTTANTAPANDKAMYVWICPWYTTDGGSTWYASSQGTTTLPTGSQGASTIAQPHNLRLLGVLNYTTQQMVVQDTFMISNCIGTLPHGWSVIITNFSGAALSTGCIVEYVPVNNKYV